MRTKEDRDSILGRALVRAFQEKGLQGGLSLFTEVERSSPPLRGQAPNEIVPDAIEHPGAEDLAALIEGKLGPHERHRIMGHVASCNECYELFSISSEMTKERQEISPIARFRMPLSLAASLLVAAGAFLVYNRLHVPSSEIIALKAAPQREVVYRPSMSAELKETTAPPTAYVAKNKGEERNPGENNREERQKPVFYAEVPVNDSIEEFLKDAPDDVVTDKKRIGELVAMLSKDQRGIDKYDVGEVRIDWGDTVTRSARSSFDKAQITIRNGVLTIRLLAAPDSR